MKKMIVLIAAIIMMLLVLRFFIYVFNCNALHKNVLAVIKEETVYFNYGSKIKYDDLSDRLKKYITEDEFRSLRTWYDVYHKFREIPKTDANNNFINRYSLHWAHFFINQHIQKSVFYRVTFVDTLLGMKIDYISVEIPGLEMEEKQ